ncbi:hypothetical protein MNY68_08975 [Moellerella wisconsensis]|nr:hypothetical protein [Moellerella wisconsensis]UNH25700.1 hypothetical protein MNY68_08975 [Moellerella wisconsensis]
MAHYLKLIQRKSIYE